VETKVTVAATVAYLATASLLTVIAAGHRGIQLVTGIPDMVTAPFLALIPAGLSFRAGWLARHTPRMARR
jgi:cellobiose-specific phosphotransferase system component IIC